VGGNEGSNKVFLRVQALPCSLAVIKASPSLRQDSTRCLIVAEFLVGYHAFKNLPGPVPMFFSEDPAVTIDMLKRSPRYAFDCMQMLLARLIVTEDITRDQAEEFLKSPTLGKTKSPLVRTWESFAGEGSSTPSKASKTEKGKLNIYCPYMYYVTYRFINYNYNFAI